MTPVASQATRHPAITTDLTAREARFAVRCLAVVLFASIFLQRFVLPGTGGVALNLFVMLGGVVMLALRGSLMVDLTCAALFLLFACCMSLSMLASAGTASTDSVKLVVLLYAPFVLSLRNPGNVFPASIRIFQRMVLICAVFGIAQYLGQFVLTGVDLFTFRALVPEDYLIPHYNTLIPLSWGSTTFKSNGFFLLEPSTFSQYLSLAILFEMLFFGATARMIVFGVALLFTYSGTGPLVLMLLLPWVLWYRRAYRLALGLVIFAVLAVATGDLWHMDVLLQRSGELGEEQTSATIRFIAAFWLIADNMRWTLHDVLFGLGPGAFRRFSDIASYEAHDPVWAKLIFEYGVVGPVAFLPFFFRALFYRAPSGTVAVALGIGYVIFGGMMLDPRLNTLVLVLCVLPKLPNADTDPGPAPHRPPVPASTRPTRPVGDTTTTPTAK